MTPDQFVFWLNDYLEGKYTLNVEELKILKVKLSASTPSESKDVETLHQNWQAFNKKISPEEAKGLLLEGRILQKSLDSKVRAMTVGPGRMA